MHEHELKGLETDNLLGFLALLGTLRAIERERPQWRPRAYFGGVPLEARLIISEDVTEREIAQAAANGCAEIGKSLALPSPHKNIKFESDEARQMAEIMREDNVQNLVASALWSDGATYDERDKTSSSKYVRATYIAAMNGGGHQNFLSRLVSVSQSTGKIGSADYIERALFSKWTRSDDTETMRWDHRDDRRARTEGSMESRCTRTEHGANRLACIGVLSFQSSPTVDRYYGKTGLATRGIRSGKNKTSVTWPIWNLPASLATIETMMDEHELSNDGPSFERLSTRGIVSARRSRRIEVGSDVKKRVSFERAITLS